MMIYVYRIVVLASLLLLFIVSPASAIQPKKGHRPDTSGLEERLLSGIHQVTFAGRRAGEGYFSQDGSMMVFQSERAPENPFYQIYLMDLETGDSSRLSPGLGKTTCAWIHPNGKKALFASTHEDPDASLKQKQEQDMRAAGKARRYTWDFDKHYDIFESDLEGKILKNLTDTLGYDAEGSWSPDGSLIVFASNRHAYRTKLTPKEQEAFKRDLSYMMDIYLMNADGSDIRRLTDKPGYDGGPFFSPDGKRIIWRNFSEDGSAAEVFTMNVDGSDKRQITKLGVMSWAPYFHPSGDYLIFTNNLHGHGNFEIYIIDTEGKSEAVRVTHTDGFDGLPVFTPDGKGLAWTSTRTGDKKAQIFRAGWDDMAARGLLKLPPLTGQTAPDITAGDLRLHISHLASEDMEGRLTGSEGMYRAARYVTYVFNSIGLEPAGDNNTFFQRFEYTSGVGLGHGNRLILYKGGDSHAFTVDDAWRPLSFSSNGKVGPKEVVFAGYGIVAPKSGHFESYDSYYELDVKDKWVIILRFIPEDITPEYRQHLNRYASLRYKAMIARDKGTNGLIIVSGPNSQVKDELVKLSFDTAPAGISIAAISVTNEFAERLISPYTDRGLKELQDQLDSGEGVKGFTLRGVNLEAVIDLKQEKRTGRNVLARLNAGKNHRDEMVIIGAHLDHLGLGVETNSLAGKEEKEEVHFGADDNASGVAALIEMAQYLAAKKAAGELDLKKAILFAAWSGEELGLLGSSHFTRTLASARDNPESIRPTVAAYLNLDMVGRLKQRQLALQGAGSSSDWPSEIEQANVPVGLSVTAQNESYLPTDATSFYLKGVPVLNAFTGAHKDYHTPRDTADKINYEGTQQVANLMVRIALSIAETDKTPDYIEMAKPAGSIKRKNLRATLGTIPDYTKSDIIGVMLSGVAKDGPAFVAGLRAGDIIVSLAGKKIENIYDYVYSLDALKIGAPVKVVFLRGKDRVTSMITPESRE